jgi:hypothetical protein
MMNAWSCIAGKDGGGLKWKAIKITLRMFTKAENQGLSLFHNSSSLGGFQARMRRRPGPRRPEREVWDDNDLIWGGSRMNIGCFLRNVMLDKAFQVQPSWEASDTG